MEIPTSHVSPEWTATEATPTYIQTSQSQKGDANQLMVMHHAKLTVLQPLGGDCLAVYECQSIPSWLPVHIDMCHCIRQQK